MAPGGGVCKVVVESHPKYVKYDVVLAKAEKNNTPIKNAVGLAEKHRMPSTNGVHELLECPVCMSLMYPPIYQVCTYFTFSPIHTHMHTYLELNLLIFYYMTGTLDLKWDYIMCVLCIISIC